MNTTTTTGRGGRRTSVAALNRLMEVCEDAQKFYASASEDAESRHIKDLFVWYSGQLARFAVELERVIRSVGGRPAVHGSLGGALLRAYLEVKATLMGNEAAILTECARTEAQLNRAYEEALAEPLAWEAHDPIRQQFEIVGAAHQHLRYLREGF